MLVKRYRKSRKLFQLWDQVYHLNINCRPFQHVDVIKGMDTTAYYLNYLRTEHHSCKVRYYVAEADSKVVMILPVRYMGNHTAEVLGRSEIIANVDAVYGSNDISELKDAFKAIFDKIKEDGIQCIQWSRVEDESITTELINTLLKENISACTTTENISIHLDEFPSYDLYLKSLSHSVRQNIRTAYNRLNRDQHEFQFSLSFAGDSGILSKEYNKKFQIGADLYALRQSERYCNSKLHLLLCKYVSYVNKAAKGKNGFIADLTIDGKPAAIMQGFVDRNKHSLEVPRLAIDISYGKYSPGILLLDQTAQKLFAETEYREINLLIGTEKYKCDMGGKAYQTKKYTIDL